MRQYPHSRTWIVALFAVAAYIVPTWAIDQARFGSPVVANSKNSSTTHAVAADLDGDGINEIISASIAKKTKGTGDGAVISVMRAGGVPEVIADSLDTVLDLDVADVLLGPPGPEVLVSTDSGLVTIWRGADETGAPAWRATLDARALVREIAVADINGDGRKDVVGNAGNTSPGNASPGVPPGSSSPGGDPGNTSPGGPKPPSNATPQGVVAWLSSNGSVPAMPITIGPPTLLFGLGDVDGDRDVDLVLTRSGGLQTLLNNGGGVYTIVALSALPYPPKTPFLVFDANRDGSADIVFGSGPYVIAMLGTSDGRFDDVAVVATVPAIGGANAFITALAAEPPRPKSKKAGPPALLIVSSTENGPQPLMLTVDDGAGYGDPFLASPDVHSVIGTASFGGNLNGDPFGDLVAIDSGRSVAWLPGVPTLEDYQALSEDYAALDADHQALLARHYDLTLQLHAQLAKNAALEAKVEALAIKNADLQVEKDTLLTLGAVLTAQNDALTADLLEARQEIAELKAALKTANDDATAMIARLLGEPHSSAVAQLVYDFALAAFVAADETLDDPRLKNVDADLRKAAALLAAATTPEEYREAIRQSRRGYQRLQNILANPKPPKPKK